MTRTGSARRLDRPAPTHDLHAHAGQCRHEAPFALCPRAPRIYGQTLEHHPQPRGTIQELALCIAVLAGQMQKSLFTATTFRIILHIPHPKMNEEIWITGNREPKYHRILSVGNDPLRL